MAIQHTGFWWDLLTYGTTEDEKKQNWNYYLFTNYSRSISNVLDEIEVQKIKARLPYPQNHDDETAVKHRVSIVLSSYERKTGRRFPRMA